jgi:hypothetical protein
MRPSIKTGLSFLQALVGLAVFDLILMLGKFRAVHRIVRRWNVAHKDISEGAVDRVIKAVNVACMLYPKQALCLQRSCVSVCLLRNQGVQADLVLGAQQFPFQAHAWVEVDGQAVNERSNVQSRYGSWERC